MIERVLVFINNLIPKNRAEGIDGSHWWGWFKPELAKKVVDFIILKATEGTNFIDSSLKANWEGAKSIGVRGMYHYQRRGLSWLAQAEFFLRVIAPYTDHLHIVALDVEKTGNEDVFVTAINAESLIYFSDMYRILEHWRYKQPDKKIVLYTNVDIYQNYLLPNIKQVFGLQGLQWLENDVELWLANVNGQGVNGEPNMPKNRTTPWRIWQYSSNGRKEDYGTNGDVDLNVFNGTKEELYTWVGDVTPPTPQPPTPPEPPLPAEPETEKETWTGHVVAFERLIARNYPIKAEGTDTRFRLLPQEKVSGKLWEGNGYVWMKLDESNPQTVKGKWVAVRRLGGDKFIQLDPQREPEPEPSDGLVSVVWDDQNPDYGNKCRTQGERWTGPNNPPAVVRFYPEMREKAGDFRVNLAEPYNWKPAIITLNGGDWRKLAYLIGRDRATYNTQGWPMQAYIAMSGNRLHGEFVGEWYRFETLKPSDLSKVKGMTRKTHPQFIQSFRCVTWDKKNQVTKRIYDTGTKRGEVLFFLVTKEGIAYIPKRHVIA